jgi:group I intron endonuclease
MADGLTAIDLNQSGIYQIKNLINGLIYIGSATKFRKRWSLHKWQLNKNIHESRHLQYAWNKYGSEAFEFKILEYCDIQSLQKIEQAWLDWTNCYDPKIGYNICKDVAKGRLGVKSSPEHVAKISKAHLGQKRSKEACVNIGLAKIGTKLTEEQKQARRDYRHTKEAKMKIGEHSKGKQYRLGLKSSIETKEKLSEIIRIRYGNLPLNLDTSKRLEI